ncbi:MAG: SUMF1/EgtB/PvdO family nonheme iron enzyme [Bacteroidales bacterium]
MKTKRTHLTTLPVLLALAALLACENKEEDPDTFLVTVADTEFQAGSQIVYNTSQTQFSLSYAPGNGKKVGSLALTGDFWVANTELTFRLYAEIRTWAVDHGYILPAGQPGSDMSFPSTHPVTRVCWYDAVVWCNALTEYFNAHNGDRPDYSFVYTVNGEPIRNSEIDNPEFDALIVDSQATGFRIPTNAEYHKAAAWGGCPDNHASGASGNFDNETATRAVAWYRTNSDMESHPVAQLLPNALGVYDMSGNVSEIMFDRLDKYDGKSNIRGGAWNSNPDAVTITSTHPTEEHTSSYSVGFRLVRTPGDEPLVQ